MSASLPAKLYLLACDTQRGRLTRRAELGFVLRGAILAELALTGSLVDRDGRPAPAGTRQPSDPLLADTLHLITEDRPRSWRSLVRWNHRATLRAVGDQLADAGVIDVHRSRILGVVPMEKVTVHDPEQVRRLHATAVEVLHGTGPVEPMEAALVSLAATGELRTVFSRQERRAHKDRLTELAEVTGDAVPALRKVLRQIRSARIAAYSSGGS